MSNKPLLLILQKIKTIDLTHPKAVGELGVKMYDYIQVLIKKTKDNGGQGNADEITPLLESELRALLNQQVLLSDQSPTYKNLTDKACKLFEHLSDLSAAFNSGQVKTKQLPKCLRKNDRLGQAAYSSTLFSSILFHLNQECIQKELEKSNPEVGMTLTPPPTAPTPSHQGSIPGMSTVTSLVEKMGALGNEVPGIQDVGQFIVTQGQTITDVVQKPLIYSSQVVTKTLTQDVLPLLSTNPFKPIEKLNPKRFQHEVKDTYLSRNAC